jgi:hypothetical protein
MRTSIHVRVIAGDALARVNSTPIANVRRLASLDWFRAIDKRLGDGPQIDGGKKPAVSRVHVGGECIAPRRWHTHVLDDSLDRAYAEASYDTLIEMREHSGHLRWYDDRGCVRKAVRESPHPSRRPRVEVTASAEHDGQRLVLDPGCRSRWRQERMYRSPTSPASTVETRVFSASCSPPHPDHFGLAGKLPPPFRSTWARRRRVSWRRRHLQPDGGQVPAGGLLASSPAVTIGPFTITPRLNDHSAFDAYSIIGRSWRSAAVLHR